MKKYTPAPKSELQKACDALAHAAALCQRAGDAAEGASSIVRPERLQLLQQQVEVANRAMRRVIEETRAISEVEELTALIAPTATRSGVDLDASLPRNEFSTRAFNCLRAGGITTVRAFCGLQVQDLMKFRNLGRKSFTEMEAYREKLGYPF